jgi:hypothetical protein
MITMVKWVIIKAGNSNEKMFPLSGKVFSDIGSSGKILNKIFKKILLKRGKLLFTRPIIIQKFSIF